MSNISVDEMFEMIADQSDKKHWNKNINWLFRKLQNEVNEVDIAIQKRDSPDHIAEEIVDVLYLLAQIKFEYCTQVNLTNAFMNKYELNAITKKKTFDEQLQKVVER